MFEAFLNGRLNYLVAASCTWRKPQSKRDRGGRQPSKWQSERAEHLHHFCRRPSEVVTESALVPHSRCRTVTVRIRHRKCGPVAMSAVTMDSCGRKRTCEEWKEGGIGSKGGVKRRGWRVCKRNSNQKRRRRLSLEERLGSSRVSFFGGRARGLGVKRVVMVLNVCLM